MPNKRSKRGSTKKFCCPVCGDRLWRMGKQKYHLFYQNPEDLCESTGISARKAKLIINQKKTYLDTSKWIEAFHCSKHGNFWITVVIKEGSYSYRPAKETDWLKTHKTHDPRFFNPSVSEFTRRMSRKPS